MCLTFKGKMEVSPYIKAPIFNSAPFPDHLHVEKYANNSSKDLQNTSEVAPYFKTPIFSESQFPNHLNVAKYADFPVIEVEPIKLPSDALEVTPYLQTPVFNKVQYPAHLNVTAYASTPIRESAGGFAQYLLSSEVKDNDLADRTVFLLYLSSLVLRTFTVSTLMAKIELSRIALAASNRRIQS